MVDRICIGDGIRIMAWNEPNSCAWSDDFNKTFKVIESTQVNTKDGRIICHLAKRTN